MDIGIMRDEYDNAREKLRKELPSGFTYRDRFTEEEYRYNFGKVTKDI